MKKIAIVYDWFDSWGGVERLLIALSEIYKNADWFSSVYDPQKATWLKKNNINNINTSFIQKLPKIIRQNRILSTALYPLAFESFDFSKYDTVITVSSSFSKGIITRPETKHILIQLTPSRWLWGLQKNYESKKNFFKIAYPISIFLKYLLRKWDFIAAQRPDYIFSISEEVVRRTSKYYKRSSELLYPPFDFGYWNSKKNNVNKNLKSIDRFKNLAQSDFYLCVSRLEPYKKCDLVVQAFNLNQKNLVIVGKGTLKNKLLKMANSNITFVQDITDSELSYLYSKAKALLIPQEEDFGYVALEAQALNCPVISYVKGGVSEILYGANKLYRFNTQSVESLNNAIADFERHRYNETVRSSFFERFSFFNFEKKIKNIVGT